MRYEIVPATRAHAEELALTMRRADVIELDAMGYAPLPALVYSLKHSQESYAGLAGGEVMAVFGHDAKGLMSDAAFPWLLTAEGMPRHAKTFLRQNRVYVEGLQQRYRLLWGSVCETNAISIRWLSWLGFTVDIEARQLYPGKPGFRYFHKERA